MKTPLRLTGIGLRSPHYSAFLKERPSVAWVEVHSENYFAEGGKPLQILEQIRQDYPISLHGVSLSLGSTDELNWKHLKSLRELVMRINPCLISDHLCWSSFNGQYLHDLLPLPYTEEAIKHTVSRIQQIQEYLDRQILIENISNYTQYQQMDMTEQHFISEIAKQSGCGILLDINNIYVSATNLGYDADQYIQAIPANYVQEIHLAGHTSSIINNKRVLIDTHNQLITSAVWDLYRKAILHLGLKPTIIEWDSELPTLDLLCLEAHQAETIMREVYVPTKHAV